MDWACAGIIIVQHMRLATVATCLGVAALGYVPTRRGGVAGEPRRGLERRRADRAGQGAPVH